MSSPDTACPAELSHTAQPRTYAPGEPLADLPVFRCHLPEGHAGVHMVDGIAWNGPARPLDRLTG